MMCLHRMKNMVIVFFWLAAGAMFAQEFRGTFSGTVTDSQGAAVAKAKIVATETRTGAKSETFTAVSGAYTIPSLAPGEYEITAEAPGFQKFVRQGITLSMGQHPVIDIPLTVGAVSQELTVTANAPLIQSANSSVGQVVTSLEVEDLPVNGRSPLMLDRLATGLIFTGEPGITRPFDNNMPARITVGGGASEINELLLDGSPNAGHFNQMAYAPQQDAVAEVQVNAFEGDASYGHTGGGSANMILKSGTNSFHGSLYEFNQTSYLDANDFFTNKAGLARPAYHYNQYGLTAAGPAVIPKVVNGRNRLFWFFGWENVTDSDPANSPIEQSSNPLNFTTVPTPAERTGNFSALLNSNTSGTNYTIYDPATGVVSGTNVARTPFPGNIIPSNRLNPVAMNYLQFYPQPNTVGSPNGLNNYALNIVDSDGYDNELGRMDFYASAKDRLFFDSRHSYRAQQKDNNFDNAANGTYLWLINHGATLDYISTVSPTMVVDVRGNWTRYIQNGGSRGDGFNPTTLGFPSYIGANATQLQLPVMNFGSGCGATGGGSPSFDCLGSTGDGQSAFDSFQIFGDVVKLHGNHSIKIGGDIREYRWSQFHPGGATGSYTFGTTWTQGPYQNSPGAPLGQEFASFLLGLPTSGGYDLQAHSTSQEKYMALYAQDDWRASANLTINLGLRWEHETPTTERYNRVIDGFNLTAANPISALAAAAYANQPIAQVPASQFKALGGPTFPSSSDSAMYHTQSHIFSPRIGAAWTPKALGGGTVIRGGFGVFVYPIGISGSAGTPDANAITLNQEGFQQTTQFVTTTNNYLSPANTLSNPFPTGVVQPVGAAGGLGTFLGQGITFFDPQPRNAYSVRWDFNVQRQLPGQMVLEVGYLGNHSVHLPVTTQLDFIPRQYQSTSLARDTANYNLLTSTVQNPLQGLVPNSTSLNGSTVALGQLLTPFPQYPAPSLPGSTSNGVVMQGNPAGESYYESLNVRLQRRLSQGLTLINQFVWNDYIERVNYLNDSDQAPEKRSALDSHPLHEVLAFTYELPIGRGKRFSTGSRLGDALLGGWVINSMATWQSGPVLSWGNVIYYGGPLNLNAHQPNGLAFDITQFNTASSQQLVDNVRTFDTQFNNLRRDATKNLDASILKGFALTERKHLEVRFETFNTTNRVTFASPQLSPTSSTFGTILSDANTPRRIQTGIRFVW
jgi:hypothetical protein